MALALSSSVLVACGGKSPNSTTSTSTEAPTSSAPAPDTNAPAITEAPITESTVAVGVTTAPMLWKQAAQDVLGAVPGVMAGTQAPLPFARTYFSLPVEVTPPDDARLSGAYLRVDKADDGIDARWDVRFTSAQSADAVETSTKAAFSDARFAEGVRVVSELKTGSYVTLNYPATAEGEAAGWGLLNITVGPETDRDNAPTGRTEITVTVERRVAALADLGLSEFLIGWERQMPPLPDGVQFAGFAADLTKLQTYGVWLEFSYHAASSAFEGLVSYYAQDLSSGDLKVGEGSALTDLSDTEYFSAGFFPTLADFTVDMTVERTLSDANQPAVVRYRVRVEPATVVPDTTAG